MKVAGDEWLLANTNVSGFFRVNYDLDNWDRLLTLLSTNHQVIHASTLLWFSCNADKVKLPHEAHCGYFFASQVPVFLMRNFSLY